MEDNEKMEKRVQDYTQEILDTIRSNSSPAVMGSRLEDYHEKITNQRNDFLQKQIGRASCRERV